MYEKGDKVIFRDKYLFEDEKEYTGIITWSMQCNEFCYYGIIDMFGHNHILVPSKNIIEEVVKE